MVKRTICIVNAQSQRIQSLKPNIRECFIVFFPVLKRTLATLDNGLNFGRLENNTWIRPADVKLEMVSIINSAFVFTDLEGLLRAFLASLREEKKDALRGVFVRNQFIITPLSGTGTVVPRVVGAVVTCYRAPWELPVWLLTQRVEMPKTVSVLR